MNSYVKCYNVFHYLIPLYCSIACISFRLSLHSQHNCSHFYNYFYFFLPLYLPNSPPLYIDPSFISLFIRYLLIFFFPHFAYFLYHTTMFLLFLSFISIVHRRFKPKIDLFLTVWIFFISSIRTSRFHFYLLYFLFFYFSMSYFLSVTSYILLFCYSVSTFFHFLIVLAYRISPIPPAITSDTGKEHQV